MRKMEMEMETTMLGLGFRGYMGIMEKDMEITAMGLFGL